ncbi:hypothetical protein R1sor_004336 [Riccia sorocarpa]|uniref:DNA polymerase V n=1 Tax=Riccia sorocarpa TaxID=122646 RepID=A0ABD3HK62_9MARC
MKKKTRVEAPLPSSNGISVAAVVENGEFANGGIIGISYKNMKKNSEGVDRMEVDGEIAGNGEVHPRKRKKEKKFRSSDISNDAETLSESAATVGKNVKGNKRKGPTKVRGDETPAMPSAASPSAPNGLNASMDEGVVPEPVGMQIYWNLSSVQANVREAASLALVKELIAAQKDYEARGLGKDDRAAEALPQGEGKVEEGLHDCSPSVQYALRRLVRGVASSRECSRQGFALALAAVLGAVPCIPGAAVIKMVEKNLEITASMKGPEVRDALLGQLFAYGAVVRSSRVLGQAEKPDQQELAKEVTQQLLSLAKKKTFLREPAAYLVAELGERVGAQGFERGVCAAPLFSDFMRDESGSPETLLLAIKLHKKLPPSLRRSCPLIPESGNLEDLFDPGNLSRLVPCLQESSFSHPRIHLVWHSLLDILFTSGPEEAPKSVLKKGKKKRSFESVSSLEVRVAAFWVAVVEGALLTSSHERKHLAMHLAVMFLHRLPSLTYLKYILSPNFLTCLLDSTSSKDNLLFKAAQQCIADICEWAEGTEERRIQLILAFQSFTNGKFDKLTKTQSVKTLISGLTTISGNRMLYKALVDINNMAVGSDGYAVLSILGVGYKKQRGTHTGEDEEADLEEEKHSRGWVIDLLRTLPQQARAKLPVSAELDELVVESMALLTPVRPLSEDEKIAFEKLQSTLRELSIALAKGELVGDKKERLQAMIGLLVQLVYETLSNPKVAVDTATEISVICSKVFGDLVEFEVESDVDESEEPHFMDVLVDVLLSLLAESSAAVRSSAEQVFKAFCADLTSSGLADLLRVVKKNATAGRHKPLVEVEEGADDDEEEVVDVEDSDLEMDDENEDGDDDEVEDDSDVSDQDEEKQDLVTSLDVNGVGNRLKNGEEREESDSEPSDLDDEAMFKFDKHLAQILKQRKHGGSSGGTDEAKEDVESQLQHFKFRVLSLLEFFVYKQSRSLLVLTILPSLLHVFINSCTEGGNPRVADRVSSILLQKLFKSKHYPKGPEVNLSALKDLLRKALKLASRSNIKKVCAVAENCFFWLLKVILGNCEKEQDQDVEEILKLALEDFFEQKKCKLSAEFFRQCCSRFPLLGNSLLGTLLDKCVHARTEHLQLEALRLAGGILGLGSKSARKAKNLSAEEVSLRAEVLKPSLGSLSAAVQSLLKDPPVKASKRAEVIQFCVSVIELHRVVYPGKSLSGFVNSDVAAAALEALKTPAPPKGRLKDLVTKLQELLGSILPVLFSLALSEERYILV